MPKKHLWPEGSACLVVAEGAARELVAGALTKAGLPVKTAVSESGALSLLDREPFAVAVVSHPVNAGSISTLVAAANRRHPEVPVVVLGSTSTVEEAVDVMRRGAIDYLPPPVEAEVLLLRLQRILAEPSRNSRPVGQSGKAAGFFGLDGTSSAMVRVYGTIEKISRYKTNVLLLGESGTGKELIARALHARGLRRGHVFVPLNCATLGRDLLENELFGHERGAFTGANERKKGLFELADGGTLFLDEIGEMDPSTQAKLLRVLERNEFRRVGGTEKVKVDLSLIAATNRNLPDLIAAGKFREDLYYRLKVVTIVVPPLRERKEDIPGLIEAFIADFNRRNNGKIKGVSPQLMKSFMEYDWRGNVRELKNAVESAAVLAQGETIEAETGMEASALRIPPVAQLRTSWPTGAGDLTVPSNWTLAEAERSIILSHVERCGNRADAARSLGIGLRTLYTKLKAYERKRG